MVSLQKIILPSWETLLDIGLRKACRVLFNTRSKSSSETAIPAGSALAEDAAATAACARLETMLVKYKTSCG